MPELLGVSCGMLGESVRQGGGTSVVQSVGMLPIVVNAADLLNHRLVYEFE